MKKPMLFVGAMICWLVAVFLNFNGFHAAAIGALAIGLVPLGAIAWSLRK